jgi:hypothetical protein
VNARPIAIVALLAAVSTAGAATDLQKLEEGVGRYATQTPVETPPPPGSARKGTCLCRDFAFGPSAGVLTMERFTYGSPQRTVVRMRCWVPQFDAATGAALPDQTQCGFDFVPLAK